MMIGELTAERDRLTAAIEALERLSKGFGRSRGETPAAPARAKARKAPKKRKRRTAVQRKAQADRMKAFWAAKRASKAK